MRLRRGEVFMKKRYLFPVLFVFIVLCVRAGQTNAVVKSSLTWYGYNEGIARARAQQRPVIIDFYASWCHWCKVMEKDTFSNEQVKKRLLADYVTIRIDMESKARIRLKDRTLAPSEFAAMMGVRGLPTLAFLDKNGEPITSIPGFIKPDILLPLLGYIRDECYKRQVTFRDYVEKKTNCRR